MARIKIGDLPKDLKVSREQMRRIRGGEGKTSLMTFNLSGSVPTSYTPPSVSSGSYDLLEESLSFLVIKVDQA